jgi:STAM-binding protein
MEEIQQRSDQERRLNEELALLKQQRQQSATRYIDDTARTPGVPSISNDDRRRREEPVRQRDLDLTFSKRPDQTRVTNAGNYASKPDDSNSNGPSFPMPSRRPDDVRLLQQQQQRQQQQYSQQFNPEDSRRLEEETARRRVEEKRRVEQEGITRRMQEAEAAAQALRQSSGGSSTGHSQYPSQLISASSAVRAPKAVSSRSAAFLDTFPEAMQMPLESPTRYEGDSTDSEALGDGLNSYMRHTRGIKHNGPPKAPARR